MKFRSKFPNTTDEYFRKAFDFAELNTPTRQALFLATIAHESNFLQDMTENLIYKPEGLVQVWPTRFSSNGKKTGTPTLKARQVAGNAYATAEAAYGGRMGNRAEGTGDGWKFRGRGPGMLTGQKQYAAADKALRLKGLLLREPERVSKPEYGMLAFASWWKDNKMNQYADAIDAAANEAKKTVLLISARKKVNGGMLGFEAFEKLFYEFLS